MGAGEVQSVKESNVEIGLIDADRTKLYTLAIPLTQRSKTPRQQTSPSHVMCTASSLESSSRTTHRLLGLRVHAARFCCKSVQQRGRRGPLWPSSSSSIVSDSVTFFERGRFSYHCARRLFASKTPFIDCDLILPHLSLFMVAKQAFVLMNAHSFPVCALCLQFVFTEIRM
ncbi:hypothetical protein SCHPADRAFT_911056 [Schizopora paradoxa]|uniref:Uncharacterized protein n=1 Tax=Schizopora paradoxa TaxID=27342 RepID=A0A0H2R273_9AGAM|nr:hypothetical protein SCHPADRAFT_911056 [Schizopora paradoxa]